MHWVLVNRDRADGLETRLATREAHLTWVLENLEPVVRAGPLLADDGETMIGSLFVLDLPDRAAVEAWTAGDPYRRAGLFASTEILAWDETLVPQR